MYQTKIAENMVISTLVKVPKLALLAISVKVPILVLLPEYQLPVFSPILVSVPIPVPETSRISIGTDTEIPTMLMCPPQYRYRNTG